MNIIYKYVNRKDMKPDIDQREPLPSLQTVKFNKGQLKASRQRSRELPKGYVSVTVLNEDLSKADKYLTVEQNYKTALTMFNRAAAQGSAYAMFRLGYIYENGLGVEKNIEKGFRYYKKGAEMKDPYAQYNLGLCYASGQGTAEDKKKGYFWLCLACHYAGKDIKDEVIDAHNLLKQWLKPEDIADIEKRTKGWMKSKQKQNEYDRRRVRVIFRIKKRVTNVRGTASK